MRLKEKIDIKRIREQSERIVPELIILAKI